MRAITIFYPDIASFQAGISLRGALAVSVKITEGTGYRNPEYDSQAASAASAGAFLFPYHFLLQGNAATQARWARSQAGQHPLMVDFEPSGSSRPGLADCTGFIDAYRADGGTTHPVYLPRWYWQQIGSPDLSVLRDRGMFLVSSAYGKYTDDSSGTGWQPYGGMTPQVWQYTDALVFNGRPVDFNAYRGSKYAGLEDPASVMAALAEFRALVSTGSISGQLPPPPPPHDWQAIMMSRLPTITAPASGEHVKTAQALLNRRGGQAAIAVDGVYGPASVAAVRHLQSAHLMTPDGVIGPHTWAVLVTGADL